MKEIHKEKAYFVCYKVCMYVCMLNNNKRQQQQISKMSHILGIFLVDFPQRWLQIKQLIVLKY